MWSKIITNQNRKHHCIRKKKRRISQYSSFTNVNSNDEIDVKIENKKLQIAQKYEKSKIQKNLFDDVSMSTNKNDEKKIEAYSTIIKQMNKNMFIDYISKNEIVSTNSIIRQMIVSILNNIKYFEIFTIDEKMIDAQLISQNSHDNFFVRFKFVSNVIWNEKKWHDIAMKLNIKKSIISRYVFRMNFEKNVEKKILSNINVSKMLQNAQNVANTTM